MHDVNSLGAQSVRLSALVGDPGLPLLTEKARDLGFLFCGIGPAFSEGRDILMLQSLRDPLDMSKLQLFTNQAKDIVSFFDADRAAVTRKEQC